MLREKDVPAQLLSASTENILCRLLGKDHYGEKYLSFPL